MGRGEVPMAVVEEDGATLLVAKCIRWKMMRTRQIKSYSTWRMDMRMRISPLRTVIIPLTRIHRTNSRHTPKGQVPTRDGLLRMRTDPIMIHPEGDPIEIKLWHTAKVGVPTENLLGA